MSLHLVPISLATAQDGIRRWHRHHPPHLGDLGIRVGCATDDGLLVGVGVAGRPVARGLDDGRTVEVVRVATDGHRNANSMLYGALARAVFALGYTRIITYTEGSESGASLRAAGWRIIAERPARGGWSHPSRPRDDRAYRAVPRTLWEADAPPGRAGGGT